MNLPAHPTLVVRDGNAFVFRDPAAPHFEYDFVPLDRADCDRWVEHLSGKQWVTKEHLVQFISLFSSKNWGKNHGKS